MLPLGVILPTKNSMAHLPAHLSSAADWLDDVAEVVVVDSHSTDGTLDYLGANLRHPALRILSHPPGLYASWNFGISQLQSPFTYISTIGETVTLQGLDHLRNVLERLRCDVVISRPQFATPEGSARSPHRWPVFELVEDLRIKEPQALSPITTFFFACLHGVGPHLNGLLGSSASNLYRTATLRKYPFPVDCGMAGDTAWCLENSLNIVLAITPEICSTFLLHPWAGGSHREFYEALSERLNAKAMLLLDHLALGDARNKKDAESFGMDRFLAMLGDWRREHRRLQKIRQGPAPWILHPRAWLARQRCKQYQQQAGEFKRRLIDRSVHADSARMPSAQ